MTTNDLISRQSALALVRDVCDSIMSRCGSHYYEEMEDEVYDDIREVDAILKCNKEIRIALRNLPSAQPEIVPQFTVTGGEPQEFVSIVRCKDCKFYTSMIPTEGVGICSLAGRHLGDDGFCSEAERREE